MTADLAGFDMRARELDLLSQLSERVHAMQTSFFSSFFLNVWPLICLILLFAHTIWGFLQVHRAVQDQPQEFDASTIDRSAAFAHPFHASWIVPLVVLAGLNIGLNILGVPIYIPVFLLFGHWLVRGAMQYGSMGLANRGVIGEYVLRVLGIVFALLVPSLFYAGRTTLDNKLVAGIALIVTGLLAVYFDFFLNAKYKPDRLHQRSKMVIGILLSGLLILWLLNTLWRPITDKKLAQYVESFAPTRLASLSWKEWAIASKWAQDSKMQVDLSTPRGLLENVISSSQYEPTIWWSAILGGALLPKDIDRLPTNLAWEDRKKSIFNESAKAVEFYLRDEQEMMAVLLMQDQGEITEEKRGILEDRLMATLNKTANSDQSMLISDLYHISILADRLGCDRVLRSAKKIVEEKLASLQVLWCFDGGEPSGRNHPGGFKLFRDIRTGTDRTATAQAIELMQIHGIPRGVDLVSLRSYLRPSFLQGLPYLEGDLRDRAMANYASKARLEAIPGISPMSWLDYARAEVHLISSIFFFALCAYAVSSAPLAKRVIASPSETGE